MTMRRRWRTGDSSASATSRPLRSPARSDRSEPSGVRSVRRASGLAWSSCCTGHERVSGQSLLTLSVARLANGHAGVQRRYVACFASQRRTSDTSPCRDPRSHEHAPPCHRSGTVAHGVRFDRVERANRRRTEDDAGRSAQTRRPRSTARANRALSRRASQPDPACAQRIRGRSAPSASGCGAKPPSKAANCRTRRETRASRPASSRSPCSPTSSTGWPSRPEWTAKLGAAFAADRSGVFASIQRLRMQAHDNGTLKSTPQQKVETHTTESGQQVIVIEPSNPQVVYVPQYNPELVYTQPVPSSRRGPEQQQRRRGRGGPHRVHRRHRVRRRIRQRLLLRSVRVGRRLLHVRRRLGRLVRRARGCTRGLAGQSRGPLRRRADVARNQQEQRTERQENRVENRPETQAARDQRQSQASSTARTQSARTSSDQSRGYSRDGAAATSDPQRLWFRCLLQLLEWTIRARRQSARQEQPEQFAQLGWTAPMTWRGAAAGSLDDAHDCRRSGVWRCDPCWRWRWRRSAWRRS